MTIRKVWCVTVWRVWSVTVGNVGETVGREV